MIEPADVAPGAMVCADQAGETAGILSVAARTRPRNAFIFSSFRRRPGDAALLVAGLSGSFSRDMVEASAVLSHRIACIIVRCFVANF
jgi:hypothetical protein